MNLILDAGAFVGAERGDAFVWQILDETHNASRPPLTHGGVIGQVWRGGGGRQAKLARLLDGVEVVPLDDELGRRAGILLARARMSDVVDAAVVLLARDGDLILTSDPDDLERLALAAGLHVEIVPV